MLTETWRILLAVFAVYRVAELIAIDDGPYEIFLRFRKWAGTKASVGHGFWYNVAELVHCPFCVGVWIAFIVALPVVLPSFIGDVFLIFLGLAGAQTFLETLSTRNR